MARGSALLLTIVNEEGGIHGRKIKSFLRDDMYNPAQTKTVVKELVEKQGSFCLCGRGRRGIRSGGMDYLAQNKIIWVGPATAIKEYVEPNNPYVFAVIRCMMMRPAS